MPKDCLGGSRTLHKFQFLFEPRGVETENPTFIITRGVR